MSVDFCLTLLLWTSFPLILRTKYEPKGLLWSQRSKELDIKISALWFITGSLLLIARRYCCGLRSYFLYLLKHKFYLKNYYLCIAFKFLFNIITFLLFKNVSNISTENANKIKINLHLILIKIFNIIRTILCDTVHNLM